MITHVFFICSINQQKEKDTLNDIVSMLIEKRHDINLKNNYGQTALHEAAQRGNLAAVDILIKHRAEINATTKYPISIEHFGHVILTYYI